MMGTTFVVLAFAFVAAANASAPQPEQVHLALAGADDAGDSTGMRIAWFTPGNATVPSIAQYGVSASALDKTARGTSHQYMPGRGYHHVALADCSGLPAGYVYYRVGDGADAWSPVFRFRHGITAADTVKVSIFGDMGYEDSTQRPMAIAVDGLVDTWSATYTRRTLEGLKNAGDIDMVWHVGDIGYMDDAYAHDPLSFHYEDVYNGYMNWLQNLTSIMPYHVSPGNHESECHSPACVLHLDDYGLKLNNFTAFNHRWHMPSAESGAHPGSNMWYSWNYGPVHWVSVDTETDWPGAEERTTGDSHMKDLPAGGFGADGEYLAWVEADLKRADAARKAGTGRPWLIAGGHRPFPRDELQPLFDKYGVDAYFAGHGHSYSRQRTDDGITWIMVGGAGCDEMAQGDNATASWPQGDGGGGVVTSGRYASGVLVANATALRWRLIDSATGGVLDELTITK